MIRRRALWVVAGLLACREPTVRPDSVVERSVDLPDGGFLRYDVVGTGPDTVVVPGGFLLRDSLAALGDRLTVIFYDPLGRGQSAPVVDSTHVTMARVVADLEELRRHVGASRIGLIGFSILSAVAANYAFSHPDRVSRLALLGAVGVAATDSAPPPPPDLVSRLDSAAQRRLAHLDSTDGATTDPRGYCETYWRANVGLFVADPADGPAFPLGFCQYPNEAPASFGRWIGWLQGSMGAYDYGVQAAALEVPVLVVHGERDDLSSLAGARRWATVPPNGRLLLLPGIGHLSYFEDAATVRAALREFFSGGWPPEAAPRPK